ncbi:MAG TPA: T9SS type A sorting domain-containing protein [Flavipsychrobacter sp.]|nr:T9SS type A sorting domain-containing protein [Flavipsychrobacter sp.]
MKKKIILLVLSGLCTRVYAQLNTQTNFYNFETVQQTVEPIPGTGEYVLSETKLRTRAPEDDNAIHFTHYRQDGTLLDDVIIDETGVDDRNVDIVRISDTRFAIVAYYSLLGMGRVYVNTMIVDESGNILQQQLLQSNDPTFKNLYATDAVYDPLRAQIVICGMATENSGYDVLANKTAFVATLDLTLTTTNMRFYNSNPGLGSPYDYDIATRIVISNFTGGYYITGSENVSKSGVHTMGIRNMLIAPTSLGIMWSTPLIFNHPTSQENSIDMVEYTSPSGTDIFYTLVNSTLLGYWHLIRLDPITGMPNPSDPIIEIQMPYEGYAHNIALGNNPWELVVSGMKYRNERRNCYTQTLQATPFMATLNVSTRTAAVPLHIEYNTLTGNDNYWDPYSFYSTKNGYPVPCYMNNFADREAPGSPYSVLTPISNVNMQLNTKYIDVAANTRNGCDDIECHFGWEIVGIALHTDPQLSSFSGTWSNFVPNEVLTLNTPDIVYDCVGFDYYYRKGNTTAIQNLGEDAAIVYPNPASGSITVELSNNYHDRNAHIVLYDVTGKQIAVLHDGVVAETTVKLSLPEHIAPGIYLLQINSEGSKTVIQQKLTINR